MTVERSSSVGTQDMLQEYERRGEAAHERYARLYMLAGQMVTGPDGYGAAAEVLAAEAKRVIEELREAGVRSSFMEAPPQDCRNLPFNRMIPGDYVGIPAKTMVGLATTVAFLEWEAAEARAAYGRLAAEFYEAVDGAVNYRLLQTCVNTVDSGPEKQIAKTAHEFSSWCRCSGL